MPGCVTLAKENFMALIEFSYLTYSGFIKTGDDASNPARFSAELTNNQKDALKFISVEAAVDALLTQVEIQGGKMFNGDGITLFIPDDNIKGSCGTLKQFCPICFDSNTQKWRLQYFKVIP
jgi:hypothetical protein